MAEFRVLGTIEAVHDGVALPLGGPRHRRLLAVLLLHAGQVVPAGVLIDALWGESPPRSVQAMVHVRTSELRTALRDTGAALLARDGGYVLSVDREDVDAWRFERLAVAGAEALAGGDARRAGTALGEALALWRGPALAEFADEPFARADAARLGELRLQATHNRLAADLDLGRHAEVVAELEKLVAEHPLRERFWEQLMLALYRSGRQGEALQAFQNARRHIADELGVDPGPELARLHQSILNADPRLTAPAAPASSAVPAQLPADVTAFTGRDAELSTLDEMAAGSPHTVVVTAVSGTAGVGKTAVALRWAHRARDRFPDGQLYVDLRGYDPDRPVTPDAALAGFLRALGVADRQMPVDLVERAALYRTLLDGRRMLVVLDNASSTDQIRPLLPGSSSCMTLVTSRDSLPGLVARHGAQRLELGLLAVPEALHLLRRLTGPRADAEPEAALALVELCARLPLALRVTAELAASRPGARLADLATELTDHQRRWDLLEAGGDSRTAVRAVFSWSYQRLPDEAARLFRVLGLHPGPDMAAGSAAALAGTDANAVRPLLETLARAHLIDRRGEDRSGMHDLLRAYAAHLGGAMDSERERRAAMERLFDHYEGMAGTAGLSWLDTELANLCAVTVHAATHGWPDRAVGLTVALWPHLDSGGHYAAALTMHEHALQAAQQSGDRASEHRLLAQLGQVHLRFGRYTDAVAHLDRARAIGRALAPAATEVQATVLTLLGINHMWLGEYLQAERLLHRARTLWRRAGDQPGEAKALGSLGHVYMRQSRYDEATDALWRAQAILHLCGDRLSEARALGNLAQIAMRQRRFVPAVDHMRWALALFREAGHRRDEAAAINGLGEIYLRQGYHDRALEHHRQALDTYREVGDRGNEGIALHGIGEVHLRRGEHRTATDVLWQALDIFQQVRDRPRQNLVHNTLGEALRGAGDVDSARVEHAHALRQATEIGDRVELARAHTGLAHLDRDAGDNESARRHYEQALAHYAELGLPEADELRDHLAATA